MTVKLEDVLFSSSVKHSEWKEEHRFEYRFVKTK